VVLKERTKTGVKLLGLSEVKWEGIGHFQSGNYKMFYSGQPSTRKNGVDFACHKDLARSVMGYNPIDDRIISIWIQGRQCNITVIQVYAALTSIAVISKHEKFYGMLQQTVDNVPRGDTLIIIENLMQRSDS